MARQFNLQPHGTDMIRQPLALDHRLGAMAQSSRAAKGEFAAPVIESGQKVRIAYRLAVEAPGMRSRQPDTDF